MIEDFPNLTTILTIYMTLSISSEAERNFPKLSIIQNKFRSTMLQERLNYLSVLSTENDITKSLSYDKKIREYAAKKQGGKKVL
jgi:glucuronate isomerase